MPKSGLLTIATFAVLAMPALATVQIQSISSSPASPQVIGTTIHWTVTATDSNAGPLTFQFNVAQPNGHVEMIQDFNVGTLSSGTWIAPTFTWTPTGSEGGYALVVVAKDFGSGESASITASFQVNPLVTGTTPVAVATANPLVALFSAPACAAFGRMRVNFKSASAKAENLTHWMACNGSTTMTFEIAGLRPNSTYQMFGETETNGKIVDGAAVGFTTGALPKSTFPTFSVVVAPGKKTDKAEAVLLEALTGPEQASGFPNVATDLAGNIVWYNYPPSSLDLLTRPLGDGILAIETGPAWNPASSEYQLLRKIDWAGNVVKETNTGAIQQELIALGAADAQACNTISKPAPIGAACLGSFDFDFIHTLPKGYSAVIGEVEKIFPAGTQGDTSGLPVDIIGAMIVVLDQNWQAVWYFDAFEHDSGAPQLDINRPAVLGETCVLGEGGCPPVFLLGAGIAPKAHDWLHADSLYYWPAPQDGSTKGDLMWSSRHQDWVMRIDYKDGQGTGDILWRMGPGGDFTLNNVNDDVWPWFSHQNDVSIDGDGDLALFDNGNTRISPPTGPGSSTGPIPGLGSDCGPNDCDSRGMALSVDESTLQVTPVLSQSMGVYSTASGSAQLLGDGNYFFLAGFVVASANDIDGYAIEFQPGHGGVTGKQVYNLKSNLAYRAWRMHSLYKPPIS